VIDTKPSFDRKATSIMNIRPLSLCAVVMLFAMGNGASAQPAVAAMAPGDKSPVTMDNFVRAESDMYIAAVAKQNGGLGKLVHRRELASVDRQIIIRLNRDTLYSSAVFDLDAGPVTITMPEPGKRYMTLQVVNEDQYTPNFFYGAGTHTLTRENVGTRYVLASIRTLVDPNSPEDLKQAHALQDAVSISQKGAGQLELPNWDLASQKKLRAALLTLATTLPDFNKSFGTREEVDPVRRLVNSAAAWGGIPDKDAIYLNITPPQNDGKTVYRVVAKDVPVDGFWSVSVYNADGLYEKNAANAYTLNNLTAKKSADGSVAVQFGGCDGQVANCLPITAGWNYTVRLYRPRAEVLKGTWSFPKPVAAAD
jgi:hypothetical protein